MKKHESFLQACIEILERCKAGISGYGVPLDEFIDAGQEGIRQLYLDQFSLEDSNFADKLHSRIEVMPIEMIRAMCLAPACAVTAYGMFSNDECIEDAHHMLIRASQEIGFLAGAGFGKINEYFEAKDAQKKNAAKGAQAVNARHAEHIKIIHQWLDDNYDPSAKTKDMAIALSKIVPREYETLLKDIPAWKKMRNR